MGRPGDTGGEDKDAGDGDLVAFIIVVPLLITMLFSGIDIGVYMSARSALQGIVRDATRNVAIFGGDGGGTAGTDSNGLQEQYGETYQTACSAGQSTAAGNTSLFSTAATAQSASWSVPECQIATAIAARTDVTQTVTIDSITCTPSVVSTSAGGSTNRNQDGAQVSCSVTWRYAGVTIPTPLTLFSALGTTEQTVTATATSETNLTG